ncbi:hypothetical protein PVAP13_7KG074200 [Panicum virgatum]|uniref:Uncharacterized protein n=1 Tax=Panicum virgatum TaxID=38727 RepID=A0A8T0Q661_PANVG|nr:hypothetical protein PVAP13_7KG074200 [Panicum virgatum]
MTWGDSSERAEHSSSRSSPSAAKPPRRPCLSPEANRRRLGFRSPGTRRPLEPPRHRIPATALRPQPPAVPLRSPPPDPAAPPRLLQLRVGAGWLGFGFPAAEAEPPLPHAGARAGGPELAELSSSSSAPGKRPSLLPETTPPRFGPFPPIRRVASSNAGGLGVLPPVIFACPHARFQLCWGAFEMVSCIGGVRICAADFEESSVSR